MSSRSAGNGAGGSDKPLIILLGDVLGSWEALEVPWASEGMRPLFPGMGTWSILRAWLELAEHPRSHPCSAGPHLNVFILLALWSPEQASPESQESGIIDRIKE